MKQAPGKATARRRRPRNAAGRVLARAVHLGADPGGVAATAMIYNHVHPLPVKLGGGTGTVLTGTVAVTFIAGFATVGALLAWKRPANPIGWLLSATGLSFALADRGAAAAAIPPDPRLGQLAWLDVLPRRRFRGVRPAALPDRFAALAPLAAGGVGRRAAHGGLGCR